MKFCKLVTMAKKAIVKKTSKKAIKPKTKTPKPKVESTKPSFELYTPFVLRWEGGWTDHKNDLGGKTNHGVTRGTYFNLCKMVLGKQPSEAGLKAMTKGDAMKFIEFFWNQATFDNKIESQMMSETITGWNWGSGRWGRKHFQKFTNQHLKQKMVADGAIGPQSIKSINQVIAKLGEEEFFRLGIYYRKQMFEDICKRNPSQRVFLKGWLNRLRSFAQRNNCAVNF